MTNTELPLEETEVEESETVAEVPAEAPVVAEETPEPDAPYVQPEPTVVGHSVIQDNVTTAGTQETRTPTGEVTSSAVS